MKKPITLMMLVLALTLCLAVPATAYVDLSLIHISEPTRPWLLA